MKFNKLMVVCIFLLAILTIGTASAADENITDTTDEVLSAEPVSEDLSVDSADDDELEASSGDFVELQSLVDNTDSGKTLKLNKDYSNVNSKKYIEISKAITIDGQGHTIDGKKSGTNIFRIATTSKVTLKNINFVNSKSSAVMGYNSDYKFTVNNCSFVDCSDSGSSYVYGGAIMYGNVYDCSFVNCSSSGSSDCYGGAIHYGDAYNCSFVDCSASGGSYGYGGAIYNGDAYNCSFVDCSSSGGSYGYGGAIYYGDAYNCSFVDCSVSGDYVRGGAIYYGNGYDCSFVDCSVSGSSDGYGGAIHSGSSTDCSFIDCYASTVGGAIYNGDAKNSYFRNCSTKSSNAAIASGKATNCTFVNCQASAAIYSIRAEDTTFGSYAYIYVHGDSNAGYANVTVNGETKRFKLSYTGSAVPFSGLAVGTYQAKVTYPGSADFKAQTVTITFKVNKANPIYRIYLSPYDYSSYGTSSRNITFDGKDATLSIYFNTVGMKTVPGRVHVTINGASHKAYDIPTENITNIPLGILKAGTNVIKVTYSGSACFNAQELSFNVTVNKSSNPIKSVVQPTSSVGYRQNITIKVNMQNDKINGNVWFTISDENKTKLITDKMSIVKGVATTSISTLATGNYYLHIYFAGNKNYNAQTIKKTFTVVKYTPIASVEVSNWAVDSDPTIKVKVNNVNGNIWFTVSDANKTKILTDKIHIEDGWAITSIPNLKVGKYYLHIYYAGNVYYGAQTIKSSFEVTKISPELSVAKTTVDGRTVLNATVPKDARGNVKFEVNGTIYKAQIVNGAAVLTLPDMAPGTYKLTSSYAGNFKYLPETKIRSITIR